MPSTVQAVPGWLAADLGPGVTAGVTTRAGGVSDGPFASLDLAFHVGDDAAAVRVNRARLAASLRLPVVYANQVHGTHVVVVADAPDVPPDSVGDADGLVTARAQVGLAVMVADCLPVLLADPGARVVGAAHAGRRGLVDGVVPAVVGTMAALGARPERIRGYLGPAICGACYEVGAHVQAEVCGRVPAAGRESRWGTPAVDLEAGVRAQLAAAGVGIVASAGLCTVEDARFYSYRRDGTTGRFVGLVALADDDTPSPVGGEVRRVV